MTCRWRDEEKFELRGTRIRKEQGKQWEQSRANKGEQQEQSWEPGEKRKETTPTHPNKQPQETQGDTKEKTEGTAMTVMPCQSKLTQCRGTGAVHTHAALVKAYRNYFRCANLQIKLYR